MISINDETSLRIKSYPNGTHFAPPFAIIAMHEIERAALKTLEYKFDFVPSLYFRCIDDILIEPIDGHKWSLSC